MTLYERYSFGVCKYIPASTSLVFFTTDFPLQNIMKIKRGVRAKLILEVEIKEKKRGQSRKRNGLKGKMRSVKRIMLNEKRW